SLPTGTLCPGNEAARTIGSHEAGKADFSSNPSRFSKIVQPATDWNAQVSEPGRPRPRIPPSSGGFSNFRSVGQESSLPPGTSRPREASKSFKSFPTNNLTLIFLVA